MIEISICICAYNEEQNIKKTIDSLLEQEHNKTEIKEIVVVSASTDRTNDIVKEYKDKRIRLIVESKRMGKANAINTFIKEAKYDICVLIGADIIPKSNAIEQLCLPFIDEKVGMTGSRVIPLNKKESFYGFMGCVEWEMAHRLSLISPKLGECTAFRKVIEYVNPSIDPHTAVDEAYLEYRITSMGYKLVYTPDAIVYNKTPMTLRDVIKQRKRIYTGHIHLKKTTHYEVSSLVIKVKAVLAWNYYLEFVRGFFWLPMVVMIEMYCMVLGMIDLYILKKNPYMWDMVKSTKQIEIGKIKEV